MNPQLKPEWMAYLLVALGGGLGSTVRFVISRLEWGTFWPWGTYLVNILGCYAIGVLIDTSHSTRWFWVVGFLGGFTTFSTFGLETWSLIQEQRLAHAALYSLGSVLTGIVGVALGVATAKL
jgi:fluoride exporter